MVKLIKTLDAWGTPAFRDVIKSEIEHLDAQLLPLQQGMTQGSSVGASKFSVMIISDSEKMNSLYVKAGVFYKSVIAGCNCADDPTPVEEQAEYCEVLFEINKATAEVTFHLV